MPVITWKYRTWPCTLTKAHAEHWRYILFLFCCGDWVKTVRWVTAANLKGDKKLLQNLSGITCGRYHFGNVTAYGIFLKWILEEQDTKLRTRLKYPNMGSTDGLYGYINAMFVCKKLTISLKNEWLSIIQRRRWVNLLPDSLSLSEPEKILVN